MRYEKPGRLALITSAYITLFCGVVFAASAYFSHGFHWILLVPFPFIFLFSYLIIHYVVRKFIFEKIKPIYKSILNIRNVKDERRLLKEESHDIIENVNQQVIKWGQARRREIEELKKLEVYRREFIGNVSHELKTPIFNIQGYVLTLLDGGLEDNTINREYLLRTEKNIDRMITIINDLETISKLEAGQLKLNEARFDLVALTRETFELLEHKAQKKKIELRLNHRYEKPIYVFADMDRIRQVLTNLIENSINYGIKRGSTVLSFFDLEDHILTEVSDDGSGISAEDIPRIFERFYRTDKARSREKSGSGLGLAIVKHIIEAHDQTINVRSTLGEGSTFAFTLRKA